MRCLLTLSLLMFLVWLPGTEITTAQWQQAWKHARTKLEPGIRADGKEGQVRKLGWPKDIPLNQPMVWAKSKKLYGLTLNSLNDQQLIKRLGKPLRDYHDCDGNSWLVYKNFIIYLKEIDVRDQVTYRIVGWVPRSPNYEKWCVQYGC